MTPSMYDSLQEEDIWFLISPPRAGSTLLAHLLGNHPDIHAPVEPWIMLALQQFGKIRTDHQYGAGHVHEALQQSFDPKRDHLLAGFAKLYFSTMLPEDKHIFLDKTPRYYWIVDWLFSLFPNARFLILHRNPLDVLASHKTTWGHNLDPHQLVSNATTGSFDFLLAHDRIAEFAAKHQGSPRVLNVRYEDLVENPGGEVQKILSAFDLTKRRHRKPTIGINRTALSQDGFGDKKILDTNSVHKGSVGGWRKVLTPEEVQFYSAWFGMSKAKPDAATKSLIEEVKQSLAARQVSADAVLPLI
ncbi:MAG: hypothetical protein CFE27_01750 [Alphaproteobacteria bacterium PA1]|nr:MAG: hypothetical protein CFE27_01750 [Alphaproteobacteria bacterium PA1]